MNPKSSGKNLEEAMWVIQEINRAKVIPSIIGKSKLKEFSFREYSKSLKTPFKIALKHTDVPYNANKRLEQFETEEHIVFKGSGYKYKARILVEEEKKREAVSSANKGVEIREEAKKKSEIVSMIAKSGEIREENKINDSDDLSIFLTPESLKSKDKVFIKRGLLSFGLESNIADTIMQACETLEDAFFNAGVDINQNVLASDDDLDRAIAESLITVQPGLKPTSYEQVESKISKEIYQFDLKREEKKPIEKKPIEKKIVDERVVEQKVLDQVKSQEIILQEQNKPNIKDSPLESPIESPIESPPTDLNRKNIKSSYSEYMSKFQIVDGGPEVFTNFFYENIEPLNESQSKKIKADFPRIVNLLGCDNLTAYYFLLSKENLRKIKCLISGSTNTPYAHGLYLFDCVLRDGQPNKLHMKLKTGLSNGAYFSPVIRTIENDPPTIENFNIGISIYNIAGVFMDNKIIQKEEGNESLPEDHPSNISYQYEVKYMNLKYAILDNMRDPPEGYEEASRYHFKLKEQEILQTAKLWVEEAKNYQVNSSLSSNNDNIRRTFETSGVGKAFEHLYEAIVKEFKTLESRH